MKAIILAAGQGTRLRPLTDDIPKCMVALDGVPLLHRQAFVLQQAGIQDILVLTGYRADKVTAPGIRTRHNPGYAEMNMVGTLFSAGEELSGDVLIVYGDIVFNSDVIRSVCDTPGDIVVGIDSAWQSLWSLRMEDPLSDAETLKLNADGSIRELGKKPNSLDDIEGQYVGLIKISAAALPRVVRFYNSLDRAKRYEGRDFANMFMTAFLTEIMAHLCPIQAALFAGGWCEVDSVEDLEAYQQAQLPVLASSRPR